MIRDHKVEIEVGLMKRILAYIEAGVMEKMHIVYGLKHIFSAFRHGILMPISTITFINATLFSNSLHQFNVYLYIPWFSHQSRFRLHYKKVSPPRVYLHSYFFSNQSFHLHWKNSFINSTSTFGEPFVGEPFVGEPFVGQPFVGQPFVGAHSVQNYCLHATALWSGNVYNTIWYAYIHMHTCIQTLAEERQTDRGSGRRIDLRI